MTASKPMTPVFRVPPDWNWEENGYPGDHANEYFEIYEDCDEDGRPTGEFSYSLTMDLGRSPGYAHENRPKKTASKLIEKLTKPAICNECGDCFEFGFEYAGRKMCLICFECDVEVHCDDGWGYGRGCQSCGNPAAFMFMVSNDAFYAHYPETEAKPYGGITCLPCFAIACPDFAEHLWRLKIFVDEDFIPEQFRVLTTAG